MPHVRRHNKKTKQPKRTKPLDIKDPEALAIHRELAALRIAGAAKPGKRRDELLALRFNKLDEGQEMAEPLTGTLVERMLQLREHYERRGGRS